VNRKLCKWFCHLNSVNTMFKKRVTQNFIPMKVKEVQAEKCRRDLMKSVTNSMLQ